MRRDEFRVGQLLGWTGDERNGRWHVLKLPSPEDLEKSASRYAYLQKLIQEEGVWVGIESPYWADMCPEKFYVIEPIKDVERTKLMPVYAYMEKLGCGVMNSK